VQFAKGVKELFGTRFLDEDIKEIWTQLAGKDDSLDATRFVAVVNSKGSKAGKALD
jgi:hypothetical protein